jgi:hypothetical protein
LKLVLMLSTWRLAPIWVDAVELSTAPEQSGRAIVLRNVSNWIQFLEGY